jgi:CheY-like chemotaxis protein
VNLALNARDAMPDGGRLQVQLADVEGIPIKCESCGVVENGNWVLTRIVDNGSGIPQEILPNVMDPFFTTKAPEGHGLGLAQVYGIVKQHDGHIEILSEQGIGTTVNIYWPTYSERAVMETEAVRKTVRGRGELILVVEDNDPMRAALREVLQMLGYEVLEASNGADALQACLSNQQKIEAVISDLIMPHMGGVELVKAMEDAGLKMKVILLTGHPLDVEVEDQLPGSIVKCLLKPPSLDILAQVVADILHSGE